MSEKSIEEYTMKMRERYARMTGRKAKTKLLDELVAVTGWERKHANKVLLGHKRQSGVKGKRGAPARYNEEVIKALKNCWLVMDQPCGKRMKDMLPIWVSYLDVSHEIQQQLQEISAASIDRHLKGFKVTAGKKVRPPKPASGVKSLVEVRAESWMTCEPGWTEVDTVAHSGGDMSGSFIWTLTSVDVASGWTELLFSHFKKRGFNLEDTHMTQPAKIEKLLGVVTLSFMATFSWGILLQNSTKLNASEKRKSAFRLGLESLLQILDRAGTQKAENNPQHQIANSYLLSCFLPLAIRKNVV